MKLNLITIPLFCLITSNAQARPPADIWGSFPCIVTQAPCLENKDSIPPNDPTAISLKLQEIEQWHAEAMGIVVNQQHELSAKIKEYSDSLDELRTTHTNTIVTLNTLATEELAKAYLDNGPASEIYSLELKIAQKLKTSCQKFEKEASNLTKKIKKLSELAHSLEKNTKLKLLAAKQQAITAVLTPATA